MPSFVPQGNRKFKSDFALGPRTTDGQRATRICYIHTASISQQGKWRAAASPQPFENWPLFLYLSVFFFVIALQFVSYFLSQILRLRIGRYLYRAARKQVEMQCSCPSFAPKCESHF